LYRIEGNLNGDKIVDIMQKSITKSINMMYERKGDAKLVQGNDTKHTCSKVMKEYSI
jgi:hypothetical protein